MKNIISIICLLLVMQSCVNKVKKENDSKTTSLPVMKSSSVNKVKTANPEVLQFTATPKLIEKKVPFNDLVEDYKYIKLETSPKCLIGKVEKLLFNESKIYVLSGGVYCFNMAGKLLYAINQRGKGPAEFLDITSMSIDNNKIYLYDNSQYKMLCYNAQNGKFIESHTLKYSLPDIQVLDNKLYIDSHHFKNNNYFQRKERVYSVKLKEPTIILDSYFPQERFNTILRDQFYGYNNSLYFIDPYLLEVYKIQSGKVAKFFSIDWDQYKLKKEQIASLLKEGRSTTEQSRKSGKAHCLETVFETSSFVFSNVIVKNDSHIVLYDKKTGNTRVFIESERTDYQPVFENRTVRAVYDEYFCSIYNIWGGGALLLKDAKMNKGNPDFAEYQLLKSVNSNDNPIIAMVKFKHLKTN